MHGPDDDPAQRPREALLVDGSVRTLPPGMLPDARFDADGRPLPAATADEPPAGPRLLAISDLHVDHPRNVDVVAALAPGHPGDWLLVVGDVADDLGRIAQTLGALRERFARVLWTPGNHDLYTRPDADEGDRGVGRYERLVEICREAGVDSPEDAFPVWDGAAGPVVVAPLFLLYDYGFAAALGATAEERLAAARAARVVATDEYLLDPAPFADRADWCADRVARTERRLAALPPGTRTVLAAHWPLHEQPTELLRHPEFALWCGTPSTADWHRRFGAVAVVYGHLHIPRRTWLDGVRFEEVSLGYPREWRRWGGPPAPRVILT